MPNDMQQLTAKAKPFQNSLSALAQVAMREAGADGYAFFQKTTEALIRQDAAGSVIAEDVFTSPLVVTYALGADGVLAFTFRDDVRSREARPQLNRLAGTIEALWRAAHTVEEYSQLAHHVAELETSLMDAKIADRTLGFLLTRGQDPIEAITRHVEGVLRETSTRRTLQQISQELEEEVEERRLVGRAKAILQKSQKMSEEEAHAHIRVVSRKSRRRLKDVALEVIEQNSEEEPCTTK
jgi:AmiR/NasT family two-component response regulator